MSETETKPVDPVTHVTEKRAYVRYVGKMPSVSHSGYGGKEYFFSKTNWIVIENEDIEKYTRKAKNNSHNWELTFQAHAIYEDVHKVRFKGTDAHKEEITLSFDDEKGEKTIKYIFKVDQWTIINDPFIAKQMSEKALNNTNIWAYQLDKVKKQKE